MRLDTTLKIARRLISYGRDVWHLGIEFNDHGEVIDRAVGGNSLVRSRVR